MNEQGETRRAVHVVDDDASVRDALRVLLETEGYAVRVFPDGEAFLQDAPLLPVGCVVMDVRMPGLDGVEVQEQLRRARPDLAVVLITGDGDVPLAVKALKRGAVDFLEKPFEPDALLASVRAALDTPPVDRREQEARAARELLARLTPREREVLDALVTGASNKEIAKSFGNSPRTVEIHRARIMAKLQARSLAEALRIALSAA